jgi:hypothetical protein
MKKECFSCQKNAPKNTFDLLSLHKRIYDTKGISFWFYKESEKGQTLITDEASFKKILPKIKDNIGAEWSHIAEFGNVTNDNIPKDIANAEPIVIKHKSKPKRLKKSLD